MALFTTVISFIHPWDAYIAKGRLEAEGVPVALADENYIWMKWMNSLAWGGVKLRVLSGNAERAEEILDLHLRGEYEKCLFNAYPDLERITCSKCQSGNFRLTASSNSLVLSILLTFGLGIVFPPVKSRYKCNECGFVWW